MARQISFERVLATYPQLRPLADDPVPWRWEACPVADVELWGSRAATPSAPEIDLFVYAGHAALYVGGGHTDAPRITGSLASMVDVAGRAAR
ncbi:hypothetical protein [Herbihabitans rhizosphaerae]|nr:hypothetical protein [Herbihabitans rhizosphaerae]